MFQRVENHPGKANEARDSEAMLTDLINSVASEQADFDGRPWASMSRGDRERYAQRASLAINTTIAHLRDNVSDGLELAFIDAAFDYREESSITAKEGVRNLFTAALKEFSSPADQPVHEEA